MRVAWEAGRTGGGGRERGRERERERWGKETVAHVLSLSFSLSPSLCHVHSRRSPAQPNYRQTQRERGRGEERKKEATFAGGFVVLIVRLVQRNLLAKVLLVGHDCGSESVCESVCVYVACGDGMGREREGEEKERREKRMRLRGREDNWGWPSREQKADRRRETQ